MRYVKADGRGWGRRDRKFFKRRKRRLERRKAKLNPECQPTYTMFRGWLL